jgi:hypothetical protein
MRWTLVVLLMGLVPGIAEACSCGRMPLHTYIVESFREADTVFVGTVETGQYERPVRFRAHAILKGRQQRGPIDVSTGIGGGDCGIQVEPDAVYLVYAYRHGGGQLATSICAPTARVAEYGLLAVVGGVLFLGAVGAVFWVGRAVLPRRRTRPT